MSGAHGAHASREQPGDEVSSRRAAAAADGAGGRLPDFFVMYLDRDLVALWGYDRVG